MSRISSYAANTTLINQMLSTQRRLFDLEQQVTTEKKSQDYGGIAIDSQRLLNLENTKSQLDRFINTNTQEEVRLNIKSTIVEDVRTTMQAFRTELIAYQNANSKTEEATQKIQAEAQRALLAIQNSLNTDVAGRFVFSGARVNNEPVDFGVGSIQTFQQRFDGYNTTVPTTRDAHLESFSYTQDENNKNKQFVDGSNFLIFAQDGDGNIATGGNSTITATSALFSNVQAGATIDITNTANNNGTYTVSSVTNNGRTVEIVTTMLTDEANVAGTTVTYRNPNKVSENITLDVGDFGDLTFNRAANTITAAVANGLNGIPVGAQFTVAGSTLNDRDYTVASNDGTTITVVSNKLTDEGLGAGNTFLDFHTGSQVVFTANAGANDDTIQVQQNGGGPAVPNVFEGLAVGDTVTFAGTTANNATYTINAISADGSTVTVNETVTNEADTDGTTVTGSNSFAYTSNTEINFDAATDTILIRQDGGGANVAGAFSQLSVGMAITVSGVATNNGNFTIASISADGSSITVNEDITVNETGTNDAQIQSFAAAGKIEADNYYNGDEVTTVHRASERRSFENDLTAVDPAFEKAVRALKLILQGEYGTAGGLDQNLERIDQARYLVDSALEFTVNGTPPFGTELTGSIEAVQQDIGYQQVLLNDSNKLHRDFIAFIDTAVADIENVDSLEAITRLLDDTRALEASYQTFARVRQLSLTNFL